MGSILPRDSLVTPFTNSACSFSSSAHFRCTAAKLMLPRAQTLSQGLELAPCTALIQQPRGKRPKYPTEENTREANKRSDLGVLRLTKFDVDVQNSKLRFNSFG